MKRNRNVRTFLCVILAVTVLTAFAAMASGGAGSQTDPLVSLSYLTGTFTDQVMDKVEQLLSQRNASLDKELSDKLGRLPDGSAGPSGGGASYAAVELAAGQTLSGEAGCEVLLRSGSARCDGAGSTGLADATSGGNLDVGAALTANHLYLMPESRSITTAEGAVLLVRGVYTVS